MPSAAVVAGGCGGGGPRPLASVIGCGGAGGGGPPMAFGANLPFVGMPIGYGGFGMPMASGMNYGNPTAGSAASIQSPPTIYVIGG